MCEQCQRTQTHRLLLLLPSSPLNLMKDKLWQVEETGMLASGRIWMFFFGQNGWRHFLADYYVRLCHSFLTSHRKKALRMIDGGKFQPYRLFGYLPRPGVAAR